jgi:hypothetical protein
MLLTSLNSESFRASFKFGACISPGLERLGTSNRSKLSIADVLYTYVYTGIGAQSIGVHTVDPISKLSEH